MAVTLVKNEYEMKGVYKFNVDFTAQNDEVIFRVPRARAMSIHAQGTFAGGSTIDLQGSNDGTNFYALPTAVSISANGIKSVALADLGFRFYKVIQLVAGSTISVLVNWTDQD